MDLTNLVLLEEFGDIQKQIVTLKATDPAISYKKIIEEIKKKHEYLLINNINCSDEGQLAYQQQHQLLR